MEDKHLLEGLKSGDEQSFRKLFEKYSSQVFNVSFSYLQSEAESEEIVQEVFFKIWLHRERTIPEAPFTPYLIRIAKNLLVNRSKRRLVEEAYLLYLERSSLNRHLDAQDKMQFDEIRKITTDYIETLPEMRKMIFKMSRNESLSNKEISQKLNISERTVENQIYRALKSVRNYLKNHGYVAVLYIIITIGSIKM